MRETLHLKPALPAVAGPPFDPREWLNDWLLDYFGWDWNCTISGSAPLGGRWQDVGAADLAAEATDVFRVPVSVPAVAACRTVAELGELLDRLTNPVRPPAGPDAKVLP